MSPGETREELERLQAAIACRESVRFYRMGTLCLLAALIGQGGAALQWRMDGWATWHAGVFAAGAVLAVVAVLWIVRGNRASRREEQSLARVMALRQELGLDDPARLLPSQ